MKKAVVGISGGVDSFVTILLLQQQGYEVIGVHLELWEKNPLDEVQHVCDALHIPLICRDGREMFRRMVVKPFAEAYLSALTPSPCCVCNSYVKWELLRQAADEAGASYIATGHYVRIVFHNGFYYIAKGADPQKDQSYFLWGVPQHILARAVTPLGEYTKAEVKAWAAAQGYEHMARKKESMGVCFLQGTDYRDFIRQYIGKEQMPGAIVNRSGKVIGRHSGLCNYTIGQKREMPVVNGQALYVAEMDAGQNVIVADVKAGLLTTELIVEQVKTACRADLQSGQVRVKVRGLGLNPEGEVKVEELSGDCVKVHLSDPAWAVAPGQPVAFYCGERVIGGGKVKKINA